jgi:diadenosine tetraphosphate (Ap4A) HIT family hydrolase
MATPFVVTAIVVIINPNLDNLHAMHANLAAYLILAHNLVIFALKDLIKKNLVNLLVPFALQVNMQRVMVIVFVLHVPPVNLLHLPDKVAAGLVLPVNMLLSVLRLV